MRARLKALSRELIKLHARLKLPGEIPRDDGAIDRLALRLLTIYERHHIEAAFALLFDLAAPIVAETVSRSLAGTLLIDPEEIVARVFLALSKGEGQETGDGKVIRSFRERVFGLAEREITRARRLERARPHEAHLLDELLDSVRGAPNPTLSALSTTGAPFDLDPTEITAVVGANFDSLPQLTQQCFFLHLVEGFSLPDVAHKLGLSLAAVSRRMSDARRQAFHSAMERDEREKDDDPEAGPGEEGAS